MSLDKIYDNVFCLHAAVLLTIVFIGRISDSNAATSPTPVQSIISGFLPSPVKYFSQDGHHMMDQAAVETNAISVTSTKPDRPPEERGHESRFGYPASGGDMSYGGVHGIYTPTKIDLGGVLIGAIVGFGAVIILPKLLQIISAPPTAHHQGYSRGVDDMTSSLVNVIDRVDFALHEQNINSSVCIERAFCQALQSTSPGSFIDSLTRNPLFTYLIEGSRVKKVLEVSHSVNGCDHLISKCPINQEVITNGIRAVVNV